MSPTFLWRVVPLGLRHLLTLSGCRGVASSLLAMQVISPPTLFILCCLRMGTEDSGAHQAGPCGLWLQAASDSSDGGEWIRVCGHISLTSGSLSSSGAAQPHHWGTASVGWQIPQHIRADLKLGDSVLIGRYPCGVSLAQG